VHWDQALPATGPVRPPAPGLCPRGGDQESAHRDRVDVIKSIQDGTSASYLVGRLSAHAAAVQVGFKRPTWTAPQDVAALALALERRYTGALVVQQP
jgi:hypothetical protein